MCCVCVLLAVIVTEPMLQVIGQEFDELPCIVDVPYITQLHIHTNFICASNLHIEKQKNLMKEGLFIFLKL
jgi:hypothetical protein